MEKVISINHMVKISGSICSWHDEMVSMFGFMSEITLENGCHMDCIVCVDEGSEIIQVLEQDVSAKRSVAEFKNIDIDIEDDFKESFEDLIKSLNIDISMSKFVEIIVSRLEEE